MSPQEAVKRFIKKGSQIAIGGFTINRNPMGMIYEIVRQGLKTFTWFVIPTVKVSMCSLELGC
jgi:acyl CoA:acetate/3-ketoacid CoA transferase alpha subunit